MPQLSDRLKALGVKLGSETQSLPPARKAEQAAKFTIEKVVPGREEETPNGLTYVVDRYHPVSQPHGAASLLPALGWRTLARWAGNAELADLPNESLAFLDTETSGLAGGVGTYTFMVGISRFENDQLHLAQFFLRTPEEEPAMLLAIERFLAPCKALVTFNGKSFDAPLLNTRYTLQGWTSPLRDLAHVDLLHLARRLYRDSLASRTLGTLEANLLNVQRSEDEVPGWMIPQMYFDYLRSGDARPMYNVFYHNAVDVISMPALMSVMADTLEDPLQNNLNVSYLDHAALGRLFEDLGEPDMATRLYRSGLEGGLPDSLFWDTLERLSMLHKRRGEYEEAVFLWKKATQNNQYYAHEELAKLYEHTQIDLSEALKWTEDALQRMTAPATPPYVRAAWLPAFEHRKARLLRKIETSDGGDP